MRKIFAIITILAGIVSCTNRDQTFADNDYLDPSGNPTGKHYGVYFPEIYPVRTLVLGHERYTNPDNDSLFHIGVSIGGMYENTRNWTVDYKVNKTLADSVIIGGTDTAMCLPDNYYSISPANTVTIPAGSFNGLIEIKLTKAFFEDPKALTKKYVVPLVITNSDADTVLSGRTATGLLADTVDFRRSTDWAKPAKNFCLFIIKYINPYHGIYLVRGGDKYQINGKDTVETYPAKTAIYTTTRTLTSTGQNSVSYNGVGKAMGTTNKLNIAINGSNVAITADPTSGYKDITGTGKFINWDEPGAEKLSGISYPTMYLQYQYTVGTVAHTVNDTIVMRERGIRFEAVELSAVKVFGKTRVNNTNK